MDDRVRELLDRVRDAAGTMGEAAENTARTAGKYAGHMLDIAKLNMAIFDLNTDCASLLREIGAIVYDTHLGRAPDDALTGLLAQLDRKNAEIDELKARIALLRSSRQCPACGASCGRDDSFCKSCGRAL